FFPTRCTDRVRTWLILTQDLFGSLTLVSSQVSGNPACWGWLVIAIAITVPDRALNTSSLIITTGRKPPCSWPRAGLRSAQTTSPLNNRAIVRNLLTVPLPQALVQTSDQVSRTRARDGCVAADSVCR